MEAILILIISIIIIELFNNYNTKNCGVVKCEIIEVIYSPFVFNSYESVVKIMFSDGEIRYYNIHRREDECLSMCEEIKELGRDKVRSYKTKEEALKNNMYYGYKNDNILNS